MKRSDQKRIIVGFQKAIIQIKADCARKKVHHVYYTEIRKARPRTQEMKLDAIETAIHCVAIELRRGNSSFNRNKFIDRCWNAPKVKFKVQATRYVPPVYEREVRDVL